jgi:leucyl aminopeptidase
MKLSFAENGARPPRAPLLVAFTLQGERPALPSGVRFPSAAARAIKGEFRELRHTDAAQGSAAAVLSVGLGKADLLSAERARRAAALAAQRAESLGAAKAAVWLAPALEQRLGAAVWGQALVEGALLGSYRYEPHKSKKKETKLRELVLCGGGKEFRAGAKRGRTRAAACAFVRDLQNAPGNVMRPRDLAEAAKQLAQKSERIRCTILDRAAMKKLGMGALLGVAQGSSEPPYLVHLVYRAGVRGAPKLALVGKGLTFDSGGISIKPAGKMWEMKYDMSGGAAVLGVFHALAELDLPLEVHGLVPCSENLPDAGAIKPGDVVTASNGTTIEVLNTDAEGRLILCDALAYAVKHLAPDAIVDLATLTGAVGVALGHEFAGAMGNDVELRDELTACGEAVGERLWPLPLEEFHKEQLRGEVADLKNIHGEGLGAGSSAGGAFLWHFVGKTPWVHLDIAGTAWGSMNRDWVGGPQGSGFGARLLLEWLERRATR